MKFHTNYDRPVVKGEVNSGEILVETAGYIPLRVQVQMMQESGRALDAYRKSSFMYPNNSLAEMDDSMPRSVFSERIERDDAERDFIARMSAKAASQKPEETDKVTKEATTIKEEPTDETTEAPEASV